MDLRLIVRQQYVDPLIDLLEIFAHQSEQPPEEKLNDTLDKPKYIKTVWGVGYTIEAQ